MKLTKAQRHKIYKKVLTILKEGTHGDFPWICNILHTEFSISAKSLPEFWDKKPLVNADGGETVIGSAWFAESNVSSRIKIIKECIRETSPKKKSKG